MFDRTDEEQNHFFIINNETSVKVILGKKLHMTRRFGEFGVVPVTVVAAGPCIVAQVKNGRDGYRAIQIGFDATKKKLLKPLAGHLKGLGNFRYLREFRMDADAKPGQRITVAQFKPGDRVRVTGVSKGKGFQGVVKRHHFSGAPKSHGHKDQLRMPGSIGPTEPKHVFKGTRMGGRMGGDRVTLRNLEIIDIDEKENLLFIRGAVPGARQSLLAISGEGETLFLDAVPVEQGNDVVSKAVPVLGGAEPEHAVSADETHESDMNKKE